MKISHIIEEVKFIHKRIFWSLILEVTSFNSQLCFSLGTHQPSLWLLFHNIDLYWLYQTEKENASRYLRVSALFGEKTLFVAFYHINAMDDLILGVESKSTLTGPNVVFIFEILMVVNALDAFSLNLLIL